MCWIPDRLRAVWRGGCGMKLSTVVLADDAIFVGIKLYGICRDSNLELQTFIVVSVADCR
jgi:hypothetical protein